MTIELIERVARALMAIEPSWNDCCYEQLPPIVRSFFEEQAQAAIAAMQADAAPVAWLVKHPTHGTEVTQQKCTEADLKYGWTETPLYAHPPVDNRVSTSSPVDDRETPETSVNLRDAVEVWRKAVHDYVGASIEGTEAEYRAAAIIEQDREAVRAEQAAELSKLREDLRAERLKPCRHTRTALAETQRPDIQAWQEAQSEWFDLTILEIVSEYAAYRDQVEAAELAKFKALAETLAFMLEAGTRFMPSSATVWHREAAKALLQYKEARDAS